MGENEDTGMQPEPAAEASAPGTAAASDSITFSRCAACRHAEQVNVSAGTLVCRRHNMCVNAEADEIPDDCVEYEESGGAPAAGGERAAEPSAQEDTGESR